jgi:hypothetical protein
MKNKEIIIELINDWYSLSEKCNWYSFNIINIYIEHEKWLKAYWFQFVFMGIGIYIRINYDVKFLDKKIKDWEK